MDWLIDNYNLAIKTCFETLIGCSFSLKISEETMLYVFDDIDIDWNKEELTLTFNVYKKGEDFGLYWLHKSGDKLLFTLSHFTNFIIEQHDNNKIRYIEVLQHDIHAYIVQAVKNRFKVYL